MWLLFMTLSSWHPLLHSSSVLRVQPAVVMWHEEKEGRKCEDWGVGVERKKISLLSLKYRNGGQPRALMGAGDSNLACVRLGHWAFPLGGRALHE
jgi:hypothetical protein